MKKRTSKMTAFVLLAVLLTVVMSMTSCGTLLTYYVMQTPNGEVEKEVIFPNSNSKDPVLSTEKPNGTQSTDNVPEVPKNESNRPTADTDIGQSSMLYASATALKSAVSIRCNFDNGYSAGSGVIYKLYENGSAFIITNFHVVDDASSNISNQVSKNISVFLYGKELDISGNYLEKYAIPATYVGGSQAYDIAVLRVEKSSILLDAIEDKSICAVNVANSDNVFPGQNGIAVGAPGASNSNIKGLSVTSGIVSVDSEHIYVNVSSNTNEVSDLRVIRIEAPVNSGNSGGGFFNDKGELIGIVNAKSALTEIDNIGYAIPSNVAIGVADNIIDYCYGKTNTYMCRALVGISVAAVDSGTEYDAETGMLIKKESIGIATVEAGGLADGKLKVNDVIKSIKVGENGKTVSVSRTHHVIDAMLYAREGAKITFVVQRGEAEKTVDITITGDCLKYYP